MADFRVVGANGYANSESAHYNVAFVEWFRGDGSQVKSYPGTFNPDMGDTTKTFRSNVSGNIEGTYVTEIQASIWGSADNKPNGFLVTKPSTTSKVEFNMEISGGKGRWMPCPVFRSISFYLDRLTYANSNFYPKHVALKLRNMVTDEIKIWGSGWNKGAIAGENYTLYHYSDRTSANQVRNMGPDWVVYGVIINWVSNGTSANQSPRARFTDFRLGWTQDGLTGTTKWVLPQALTWGNLTSMIATGQRKFVPSPIGTLTSTMRIETNWESVTENTFTPHSNPVYTQYNKWPGNCKGIRIISVGGRKLNELIGSYSNVTVKCRKKSDNTLLYEGNLTEIIAGPSNFPDQVMLAVSKTAATQNEWPQDTDIDVTIEGLG